MSRITRESRPVATFTPLPSHDRQAALPARRSPSRGPGPASPGPHTEPPGPCSAPPPEPTTPPIRPIARWFARAKGSLSQGPRWISGWPRGRRAAMPDAGMSTAEYAIGTVTACVFAGVFYKLLTGSAVSDALTELLNRALHAV